MKNTSVLPTIYAIGFFVFASHSLLFPVMPLYATRLGASVPEVGLIMAFLPYGMALFLTPSGLLCDRFGRRTFLIIGLTASTLASFLYVFTTNPIQLSLIRVLNGIGLAAMIPANFATVVDLSPAGQHGKAIGWYTTTTNLGLMIGPVIGGYILNSLSFEATFIVAGILSLAGLAIAFSRFSLIPQRTNTGPAIEKSWKWLTQKTLYGALLTTFAIAFGQGVITAFIPLYGEGFGINATGAGLIITLSFASSAMARAVSGTASDEIGRKPLIIGGLAIGAVTVALVSIFHNLILLSITSFCFGIGVGIIQPSTMALIADLSPKESRGLGASMVPTAFQIGYALGPTAMGAVAGISNLETMFFACGLSMASVLIIATLLLGKMRKPNITGAL